MVIKGQAPGTILQFMFIRNRLNGIFRSPKKFIEVGSGKGFLSNLLLKENHIGLGVDLNESACEINKELNQSFVQKGKYEIRNKDFNQVNEGDFDFLISCMVIEHIPDTELELFMQHAKKILKPNGKLIFLVPSNKKAWGIEDEIAGHVKRYDFDEIIKLAVQNNMELDFKCGLNFPLSNWLLKLSNKIVTKNEVHLNQKTVMEKTIYTGNRQVKFKTVFPFYLNIILNEFIMMPFYLLQQINKNNEKSLVMYFELSNRPHS